MADTLSRRALPVRLPNWTTLGVNPMMDASNIEIFYWTTWRADLPDYSGKALQTVTRCARPLARASDIQGCLAFFPLTSGIFHPVVQINFVVACGGRHGRAQLNDISG